MILPNINVEANHYEDEVVPRVQIIRRVRHEAPVFLSQYEIAMAYSSMVAELRTQRQELVLEQMEEKDHVIKMEIGHKIKRIDEALTKAGVTV